MKPFVKVSGGHKAVYMGVDGWKSRWVGETSHVPGILVFMITRYPQGSMRELERAIFEVYGYALVPFDGATVAQMIVAEMMWKVWLES